MWKYLWNSVMGRVCKSFEVHAKKKKKDYVAVGGLLDVILERAQEKKKKDV